MNRREAAIIAGSAAGASALTLLISHNFFAGEKKIRQLIETDYGVGDPAFFRTIGQLLGPPLLPGNRLTALQNGDQIFPAMLAAIRGAERSITFENYVLWSGQICDTFLSALAERARAGVKVHFLQDALGCDCTHSEAMRDLRRAGAEVEIYRLTRFVRMNQRTHRKILVCDGRVGFIGGAGIADCWAGSGDRPGAWRDSHYQLEGPTVAQLQQAFVDNWMQTRAIVLHGDDYFPELPTPDGKRCQVFKSSAEEGSDSARIMFMISIASAKERIQIANAYFVPDDLLIATLVAAARRGVKIEIVVPGPWMDNQFVRAISQNRWEPLLRAGIRIYEFQPTMFHCKYMIVDRCWTTVGSTNLDNRSLRLNDEANLNVLDEKFAAQSSQIFEQDKANSREVTLETWLKRPLRSKLLGRIGSVIRTQV